jgi:hypothetical protein
VFRGDRAQTAFVLGADRREVDDIRYAGGKDRRAQRGDRLTIRAGRIRDLAPSRR